MLRKEIYKLGDEFKGAYAGIDYVEERKKTDFPELDIRMEAHFLIVDMWIF